MENNKIFNLLDKAIQILGRCWDGYKPVSGVKPYEAGSCEKEMATQSDLKEIQEVIDMLDKAIQFYDPNQPRDASGRWGSGGGAGSASSGGSDSGKTKDSVESEVIEVVKDVNPKTGKEEYWAYKSEDEIKKERKDSKKGWYMRAMKDDNYNPMKKMTDKEIKKYKKENPNQRIGSGDIL